MDNDDNAQILRFANFFVDNDDDAQISRFADFLWTMTTMHRSRGLLIFVDNDNDRPITLLLVHVCEVVQ